ncbi:MAG TPA: hypothetical protein VMD75_00380 [Candidatus Binataceae bacterium]|nr:hypothetical protein [Candidatus Binataceae bacterium]
MSDVFNISSDHAKNRKGSEGVPAGLEFGSSGLGAVAVGTVGPRPSVRSDVASRNADGPGDLLLEQIFDLAMPLRRTRNEMMVLDAMLVGLSQIAAAVFVFPVYFCWL